MTDWKGVPVDQLPTCMDDCERPYRYVDPVFGYLNWNCPYRFGVRHALAVGVDGTPCKHWKKKRRDG